MTDTTDRDELVDAQRFLAAFDSAIEDDHVIELYELAERLLARIRADAATIAGMIKWDQGGLLFDALCRVRCRNAADFSDRFTASQREAYDKAVLACFAEIEATLNQEKACG